MTLSDWDPTRDMGMLQERMNKLFEESLRRGRTAEQEYPTGSWTPAVDIYETDDRIVLKADLPGVEQGAIDLRIDVVRDGPVLDAHARTSLAVAAPTRHAAIPESLA